MTLCLDSDCFVVIELDSLEALVTNDTIFTVNGTNYEPLDFAENVTEPNVTGALNETVICLEGDLNCYIPIEVVNENSTTGDQTVRCWYGWCYTVGEPFGPSSDNNTKENNTQTDNFSTDSNSTEAENITLCIDLDCFLVLELTPVDALTTSQTIFDVDGSNYEPLDFAYNVTEPNVTVSLNETVICLEDDLLCYKPIEVVNENTSTGN